MFLRPGWRTLESPSRLGKETSVFKKIVVATDGSEQAQHALEVAQAMASENGGKLTVVHVVQRIPGGKAGGLTVHVNEDEIQARVQASVAELTSAGLEVSLKVVDDLRYQPGEDIAEVAQEEGADLIVVGTRGYSAVKGLLLGSVTQRLLHVARCPVLAVPPTEE
jgi:nucleotide-binding universal stress UspA family protein